MADPRQRRVATVGHLENESGGVTLPANDLRSVVTAPNLTAGTVRDGPVLDITWPDGALLNVAVLDGAVVDGPVPDGGERFSVCIATFRRTTELANLLLNLSTLAEQHGVSLPGGACWYETIVIDNSPEGAAQRVVEAAPSTVPSLRWVHEPSPGLSAARNRAVAESIGDVVCFIDDDQIPESGWLQELARPLVEDPEAAAVVGAVRFEFDTPPPDRLRVRSLFADLAYDRVEEAPYFHTGNSAIRRRALDGFGPWFDERFGLAGGEDHHLGLRMEANQLRIITAPASVVSEPVPQERCELRPAARRVTRKGWALAATDLAIAGDAGRSLLSRRMRHATRAVTRLGVGAGWAALSLPRHRSPWPGVEQMLLGLGQLGGAVGLRLAWEYQRPTSAGPVTVGPGVDRSSDIPTADLRPAFGGETDGLSRVEGGR